MTEDEIRTAVQAVIDKEPNPEEIHQVAVAAGLRRLAASAEHPASPERGPSASGVAAQRMVLGYLDEDQQHAVGIDDMHLVQPPRFLRASRAIATPRPVSSFSVAYTSRT